MTQNTSAYAIGEVHIPYPKMTVQPVYAVQSPSESSPSDDPTGNAQIAYLREQLQAQRNILVSADKHIAEIQRVQAAARRQIQILEGGIERMEQLQRELEK